MSADDTPTPQRERWWQRPVARHVLVFALGVSAMTFVQSGSYEPAGHDSFYHTKMAVLLPGDQGGFPDRFPWLHHTIFNRDRFVSHHHGFHLLLVPFVHGSAALADLVPQSVRDWAASPSDFGVIRSAKRVFRTWFSDRYMLGAKVLNIMTFGFIALLCSLILARFDLGPIWFWILALGALPGDFYLRMAYIRAPSASLAIMLLIVYACMTRRFILVAIGLFCYGHLYAGGFIFGALVTGVFGAVWLVTGQPIKALGLLVLATAAGLGTALLTHPYSADMFEFLKLQIFDTGLQTGGRKDVGSEWSSYAIYDWLKMSAFVLAVIGVTFALRFTWNRLLGHEALPFILLNLGFLGLCLRAKRFIEYWPIFCLLSSAVMWSGFGRTVRSMGRELQAFPHLRSLLRRLPVLLCAIALVVAGVTLDHARSEATCGYPVRKVLRAMEYLREQSEPGALVMADDWDMFPIMFYYNHHNHYVCGLDPQFTASIDPVLWERYKVLTRGKAPRSVRVDVPRETGDVDRQSIRVELADIRTEFDADYVLVDRDHDAFYRDLSAHPDLFEFVYPQAHGSTPPTKGPPYAIFRVRAE